MTTPENNSFETQTDKFIDSEFRYTLFPVFYGVVFVLGLLANCGALYVLHKMWKSKAMKEFNIYMTNLIVADLLFVSFLPFWIGYYVHNGDWKYSDALCRIAGSFFFISTYSSILFITAISVIRYQAVTRLLPNKQHNSSASDYRRRGAIVSAVIWVVTLVASVKYLTEPGIQINKIKNKDISRCFEGYQGVSNTSGLYAVGITYFIVIGLFFLVFTMVIVCNILIARVLLSKPISADSGNIKHKALRLLCVVLGVFVICFLPHHVVQGPWTWSLLYLNDWSVETRQRLNDAHQITLMLMGTNCLLDPLVFFFATTQVRTYIQGLCSPNTSESPGMSESRHQSYEHIITNYSAAEEQNTNADIWCLF